MKKIIKFLAVVLCANLISANSAKSFAESYTGGLPELKQAISSASSSREFIQTANITADGPFGTLATANSFLQVTGNGSYYFSGNNLYQGFVVDTGQSLSINAPSAGNEYNAVFQNFKANSGGAIYSDGTLSVYNTKFLNNGGSGSVNGGAVFIYSNSNPSIIDKSYFEGNQAYFGAGVYTWDNLTISNSIFKANHAQSPNIGSGGAVSVRAATTNINNTVFEGNYAGSGGAITSSISTIVTVSNSQFSGNNSTATNGVGGAIYNQSLSGSAFFKVINSSFTGNYTTATGKGGAIYNEGGKLYIVADGGNTTFSGNTDSTGNNDIYNFGTTGFLNINSGNGGIVTFGGSVNSASNSFIIGVNTDTVLKTGTVNFNSGIDKGTMTISGGTTNFNNGTLKDLAIGITDGNQNFTNNTFLNSRINLNKSSSTTTISGATFSGNNFTGSGAAINVASGTLDLSTSSLTGYTASVNGGALYNAGNATIKNTSFTSNTATTGLGGAIYNSGTLNIKADASASLFSGNTDSTGDNAIYLANGTLNLNAGNGGIITFNDGISSANTNIAINVNTGGVLDNGTVNFNSDISKGIMTIAKGTTNFKDGTLNNLEINATGGIQTFSNNTFNASRLNVNSGNTIDISGSDFTGNSYLGEGGAILLQSGTLNINSTDFSNNTASSNGGAIENFGTLNITNSTFSSNTSSTGQGGAIYNRGNLNIKADAGITSFTSNKASSHNNAIFFDSGTINLNAGNGGAITFNDAIASTSISNEININSGVILNDGTVNFNNNLQNAVLNIYSGTVNFNNDLYLEYLDINLSGGNLSITGSNPHLDSTRLDINNALSVVDITNANFNTICSYHGNGGFINLISGTLNVTDTFFVASEVSGNGGAIFNSGTLNLVDTSIQGTKAGGFGGAIYNAGTLNLKLNDDTSKSFSNEDSSGGNDIYLASGVANINTGSNSTLSLNSGISSALKTNELNLNKGVTLNSGKLCVYSDFNNLTANIFSGEIEFNLTSIKDALIKVTGGDAKFYGTVLSGSSTLVVDGVGAKALFSGGTHDGDLYTGTSPLISVINGELTLAETFKNYNQGTNGSVVNLDTNGILKILGSYFYSNGDSDSLGGAIYNKGSANIKGGFFGSTTDGSGNKANKGGAIYNTSSGIMSISNGGEYINNSSVSEGGAIYNQGVLDILNTVVFKKNTAQKGGAIYNTSTVNTTGVIFGNDTAGTGNSADDGGAIYNKSGTLTIDDSDFTNNIAALSGGAIYNEDILIIKNSSAFNKNNAVSGGAIYNSSTGNVSLTSSAFGTSTLGTGNSATDGGAIYNAGALTSSASTFTRNTATSGGAIYNSGDLTVENSSAFNSNSAANGGAVYNIATVDINNSSFTSNTASSSGGAIYNTDEVSVTNSSTFTSNSAVSGGAVYNTATASFIDSGSTYTSNNASDSGGAIYNAGELTLSNTTFGSAVAGTGNSANNGGAVFNSGNAEISGSTFTNNSAVENGGAINNSGTLVINGNSSFTSNTAKTGGAIYNTGTATIKDVTMTNNSATTLGGAIYNEGTLNIQASNGTTTSFSGNTDSTGSNAIYLADGTLNLNAGANGVITFYDKITSSSNDNVININSDLVAPTLTSGTINFFGGITSAKLNVYDGTTNFGSSLIPNTDFDDVSINIYGGVQNFTNISFLNGTVVNVNSDDATANISHSLFKSNSATNGGAVYNATGGDANFVETTFESNSASVYGGAIYNTIGSASLQDSIVKLNSAVKGGAIYNDLSGTFVDDSSSFTSNTATSQGGAIYNLGDMTLTGSKFGTSVAGTGNSANQGGAIYNAGELTIVSAEFKRNSATTSGGAIYNSASAEISDTVFSLNSAQNGGAIYNTADLTIKDSTFSSNSATSNGGAIYNSGNLSIKATNGATTSFTGNTDSSGSNAVYLAGGTLNINSGVGSNVIFNDAINSSSKNNIININSPVVDALLNSGTVKFNGGISLATLNVFAGTTNFGDASIDETIFSNVLVKVTGGTQNITNATFNQNSKIELNAVSATNIVDSLFNQNSSTSSGGVINNSAGTLNIASSVFSSNSSDLSGGAIYNASENTVISGTTFSSNHASQNGGAILNTSTMNVSSSGFTANTSGANGGAIANSGTLTITDTAFSSNDSDGLGGAIYNSGTLNLEATSGHSTLFTSNTDSLGSNAIYLAGGTLNLNAGSNANIVFNDKISSSSGDNVININSDLINAALVDGTVKFNADVSSVKLNIFDGVTNFGNSAIANTNFNNTLITISGGEQNFVKSTLLGGSRVVVNGSDVETNVANSIFTGSNYTGNAGLILVNQGTLNLVSSLLSSNRASGNGGVIYNEASGLVNDSGSTFLANNSGNMGGAIYNLGNMSLVDTIFGDATLSNANSAVLGGAIYNKGDLSVSGAKFLKNTAESGGAIYNETNASVSGSQFTSNTTDLSGGAIYNKGILTITDSVFLNNSSSGLGGAIYNEGTLNIKASSSAQTSFSSNSDTNGNNAIYLAGGVLNLNADTDGAIIFNDSIKSSSHDNVININSALVDASKTEGSVVFKSEVESAKINIKDGITSFGDTNKSNVDYKDVEINITGGEQYITKSTLSDGSRILMNNAASTANITNTKFVGSNVNVSGGAINNTIGTINLVNTEFKDYASTLNGGAISNAGNIKVSNTVFDNNQALNGGAVYNTGTAEFVNTSFTNNKSTGLGGAIYNNGGTVNVIADNSAVTFSSNTSAGNDSNAIYLATSGTNSVLNLNAGNGGVINFEDKINSDSRGNTININNAMPGAPVNGSVNFKNTVSNSTINFYNGTIAPSKEEYLNGNNLNLYGGYINLINSQIGTMNLNALSLTGTTNIGIDADLANSTADKITSATLATGAGMMNINNVHLLSDSEVRNTAITIADLNVRNNVQLGVTSVESPLYKYNLSYNSATGSMGFENTGKFSPSVITNPVASSVGSYLNQTNTYNEALSNVDGIMFLPRLDRLLLLNKNKTALATDQFVFSPTILPEEEQGWWVKTYSTFENIPLSNGPNVSNVAYGTLFGRDSQMRYLGRGFYGYATAYAGYNGSHQNYDHVGTYQNGGLIGLSGTVYKGNFFGSMTVNTGAAQGNNYTSFGVDNFTTVMAGTAAKVGYNFEFLEGKLIVQPSYMMSYTFANTFEYTTAAGTKITSDPLNAVQIIPGIKVIGNLKNGWQPYVGVNMVWNIMDSARFYANDVQLPQLSVDPYVEYGFGLQRRWGDRMSGFAQAMARGGGRNGVSLQFGFRWAIGK